MVLNRLHIIQFKNYAESKAAFGPGFNFITGLNGMGKTNLLDAIYYLGMTKSFFHNRDRLNVRQGDDFFRLVGDFSEGREEYNVVARVRPGHLKSVEMNDQKYEHLIDHIGVIPMLMSTPSDSALIMDSSRVRRRFFDALIGQMDQRYLRQLMTYNRFLRQRNAGLKKKPVDFALMDVYAEKMAGPAQYIYEKRNTILAQVIPHYKEFYRQFGGASEHSDMLYKSQLHKVEFLDALKAGLKEDSITGRTSTGIHKDDFILQLNSRHARYFASQGQMKSILFALHLSKFRLLKEISGKMPIMLLDDIFDKLDDRRLRLLIETLQGEGFGQVFVTDTSEERLRQVVRKLHIRDARFHEIRDGNIHSTDEEE